MEMQREDVANRFVVAPVLRITPERVTSTLYDTRRNVTSYPQEKEREQCAKDKRHFTSRRIGDNELIIVVEIAMEEAIGRVFLFMTRELISGWQNFNNLSYVFIRF